MKEKPKRLLPLLQGFLSQPDRPDKDKKFKFIRIRTIEAVLGEIRLYQHGSNAEIFFILKIGPTTASFFYFIIFTNQWQITASIKL